MTRDGRSSQQRARRRAAPTEVTAALDALRRIVRALQYSHRLAEQKWDVSAAQLLVLQRLADGSPLSINDLAERTFTHQSTVSVVVSRLVRRGLVVRQRSADDARRTEITLTAPGRRLLAGAMTLAQTRLIDALQELSPADLKSLTVTLHTLVEKLGVSDEPAAMFFEEGAAARRPAEDGRVVRKTPGKRATGRRR